MSRPLVYLLQLRLAVSSPALTYIRTVALVRRKAKVQGQDAGRDSRAEVLRFGEWGAHGSFVDWAAHSLVWGKGRYGSTGRGLGKK